GSPHVAERPSRLDPGIDMHASRPGGLRPPRKTIIIQNGSGRLRHFQDLPPAHAGHPVEVDPQFVRAVQVIATDPVRVHVAAAQPSPAASRSTTSAAVRPEGKLRVAVSIHSGRFSGARFWKNGSASTPLTNRFSAIGRPVTPRSAPSATAR